VRALTATLSPEGAEDRTVKWSVAGTAVKLYSDASCKNEIGTKATDARTVYVKGVTKGGKATVTVKSNTDDNKRASAVFTVVPHAFEYTASGNTITATCTLDDCPLKSGDTRYSEKLRVVAPSSKPVYTGAAFPATLAMSHSYSEFAEFTSLPAIKYQKKAGETWSAATQTAPVEPGTYRASVTLKPAKGPALTGTVEYDIAKARLLEWSVKQVGVLTYTGKGQTPKVTTAVKSVNKQPVTFTYSRTYDGPYSEAVPSVTNVSECSGFFCFKVSAPFHEDAIGLFRINMQKAKAPALVVPTLKSMTYDPHTTLADIPLTGGWEWVTGSTVPTAAQTDYPLVLAVDDGNYDYTGVEDYNARTHAITRSLKLNVKKAEVTPPVIVNKPYTGNTQTADVKDTDLC